MTFQPELTRSLSWTTRFQVYDDGLGDTRQPNQKLRFFDNKSNEISRKALIDDLKSGKTAGTTGLPTAQELDESDAEACRGLWVGWCRPLQVLPELNIAHRNCSIAKLVTSRASKAQLDEVIYGKCDPTALKVIGLRLHNQSFVKYYALAYPDSVTGICTAVPVPGGGPNVFFFPEFRDKGDTLASATKRHQAWNTLVFKAVTSSDPVSTEGAEERDPPSTQGSLPIHIQQHPLGGIRSKLAELRETRDLVLYKEVMAELEQQTGFKFPSVPTFGFLERFLKKERLDAWHSQRVVDDFFVLHPRISRASMPKLTCTLVQRVSDFLSRDNRAFPLDWSTVWSFLSNLAYLCDAEKASDGEVEAMVVLVFQMVESPSSDAPTSPDNMQTFITNMIDFIETILAAHEKSSQAADAFHRGSDDLSGSRAFDRWVDNIRKRNKYGAEGSPRPLKKRLRKPTEIDVIKVEDDSSDLESESTVDNDAKTA
ncbi:uncharacterized protein CTRU02_205848 [Colletotrichum truncatum]|uniref:Uncharacterized protein n=1 Tax=Colletotrichum truncatum TaxID=5467 RepID=A0ACC3Z554_COLTU|nr:uncharacterized protein CTRU02_04676 [Colletotrichum truncatum]KAF6795113.1 hypothetical protein CTRU02_04676 [Colletotrichum truncatum]